MRRQVSPPGPNGVFPASWPVGADHGPIPGTPDPDVAATLPPARALAIPASPIAAITTVTTPRILRSILARIATD